MLCRNKFRKNRNTVVKSPEDHEGIEIEVPGGDWVEGIFMKAQRYCERSFWGG